MICNSCKSEAYHVRSVYEDGRVIDMCNNCSGLSMIDTYVPDVYYNGKQTKFGALCDEMGRPYEITSKRHKAEIMNKLGVSEVGDRINGAPFGSKSWSEGSREYRKKQFDKDRPMIRETYQRYLANARRKKNA